MITIVGENERYKNFKWFRQAYNFLRRLKSLLYKQGTRHPRKALKNKDGTCRWKLANGLMWSESLFNSAYYIWKLNMIAKVNSIRVTNE